jgi:hypothetical protein
MKKEMTMKRILLAGIIAVGASLLGAPAPEWIETELPNGYCWQYGTTPIDCDVKPGPSAPTAMPVPTPTPERTATPAPTLVPPVPELVNPDFESGFAGWQTVVLAGSAEAVAARDTGHDGALSLRWANHYACWRAGVRQSVSTLPGTRLRFSIWGRTWASATRTGIDLGQPSDLSVNDGLMVGIDPSGGTDPRNSAIAWIAETGTEKWMQAGVESAALGNRVTVYALLNQGVNGAPGQPGGACEWALATLAGWLDEAVLEVAP